MATYEWDEHNEEHLARHGITPREAEEALDGITLAVNRRTGGADRVCLLGRTTGGRYLVLIVQKKEQDVLRPFSGWDMTPRDKELYERQARE